MKMAAYGQTATKNGVILKFVVGDSHGETRVDWFIVRYM